MKKNDVKITSVDDAVKFMFEPENGPSIVALDDDTKALITDTVVDAVQAHTEEKIKSLVSERTDQLITSTIAELLPLVVDQQLSAMKKLPREIIIVREEKDGTQTKSDPGHYHKQFEELLDQLSCGNNVALVGPAGSGKSHAVRQVAKALGRNYFEQSFGPGTGQHELLGYQDANGKYITTAIRQAYEQGNSIWLGDELDAANSKVPVCLNGILDSPHCGFPNGSVMKGENTGFCVTMNTYGKGFDRRYVGRNELDGATLNRFSFIHWEYDEQLELVIASTINSGNVDWTLRVQAIRQAIELLNLRIIVSPRQSFMGERMLRTKSYKGNYRLVEDCVIWPGIKADEKAKILAKLDDLGTPLVY